ncbi:phosphopantetheine-binding protein [Aliikangiella sp. IMCC44359]|uniref:phosphopantetheine-binding protein n=1 Tax=Aliikangiella sp. IMCC44359 TaxID=3459125 RepID=UPI00403A89DB
MSQVFEVLKKSIVAIQEQLGYQKLEVLPNSSLLNDLGFASLDIAQLVAMMEKELGTDPFSKGATLDQVNTVEDMVNLYA